MQWITQGLAMACYEIDLLGVWVVVIIVYGYLFFGLVETGKKIGKRGFELLQRYRTPRNRV